MNKEGVYHNSTLRLIIELIILFIGLPIFVAFNPFHIPLMLILLISGILVYFFLRYDKTYDNTHFLNLGNRKKALKSMIFFFSISTVFMIVLIYLIDSERAFFLIKKKPLFLLLISIFYPLFSVIPQTLIYRALFFHRYKGLFKSKLLQIVLSAVFFSFGHILYKNGLVLVLSFVAGLIFAYHFSKTKSVLISFIEHSLYGIILFASGLGFFFVSQFVK